MWIDDDILERRAERTAISCWIPSAPLVVLGSSNVADVEVDLDACAAAHVPVLKRYGGGGTVVLHDGCVVVSVGGWVTQAFQNKLYFEGLNRAVIAALAARWPRFARLGQRGLSDLVDGDKKVAGTSLFRSRNYLLYQASILVDPQIALVTKLLKHPSKEPDYRQGRSHGDFMTGLAVLEPAVTVDGCREVLRTTLARHLDQALAGEWIEPIEAQFPALDARAERGRIGPSSSPAR
jgi:lipoate-protein ligase A